MDHGSDRKKIIRRAVRYAGNILAVIAIIFLIRYLIKLDLDITILLNGRVFTGLVISIILCIFAGFFFAINWRNVLSSMTDDRVSYPAAVSVYLRANMAKYIPGNVFHYVERNLFAESVGLDQKKIALSSVIEILGQICAAVVLSLLFLNTGISEAVCGVLGSEIIVWILGIALGVLIVAAIVYVIRHKCIQVPLIYLVCYILLGLGMLVLVCAIEGAWTGWDDAELVMGTYVFSWLAGFIVPGAPGGIGIRELVVTVLTRGSALGETILLAAILHRFASVISDAITYAFGLIMAGRIKGTAGDSTDAKENS